MLILIHVSNKIELKQWFLTIRTLTHCFLVNNWWNSDLWGSWFPIPTANITAYGTTLLAVRLPTERLEDHIFVWCLESEVAQSCLTLCDLMDCSLPGSSVHGIFQARLIKWGCPPFLLQGIFPTQGSKPGLWHCRQTLHCLSHQGSLIS